MTQQTQQTTAQAPTHPAALGPEGLGLAPEAAFVKTLEHFVQKANVFAVLAAKQKIEPDEAFQHLNTLWRDVAAAGESLSEPAPVAKPAAMGLTAAEARLLLAKYGPNQAAAKRITPLDRLYDAVKNPLVLLLFVLGSISYATNDVRSAVVIIGMAVLGVTLKVIQEAKADKASPCNTA